jgi:hypothetical protein
LGELKTMSVSCGFSLPLSIPKKGHSWQINVHYFRGMISNKV